MYLGVSTLSINSSALACTSALRSSGISGLIRRSGAHVRTAFAFFFFAMLRSRSPVRIGLTFHGVLLFLGVVWERIGQPDLRSLDIIVANHCDDSRFDTNR